MATATVPAALGQQARVGRCGCGARFGGVAARVALIRSRGNLATASQHATYHSYTYRDYLALEASSNVHRLLLKKSEYHVYLVRQSEESAVIVSIWSARRRRGLTL
jgi:hypothetical protein